MIAADFKSDEIEVFIKRGAKDQAVGESGMLDGCRSCSDIFILPDLGMAE